MIVEFIAKIYLLGVELSKYVLLFMGIMSILWLFQLMRDPKKQFDLAMDLFKSIFVWIWKGMLFVWMCIMFVVNLIVRLFSVTFATVRDFFVSRN